MCVCLCVCVRHKHDKEWRLRQGRQCERAREGWWEVDRCVCRPVCHCCCRGGGRGVKREDTHTHLDAALYHFTCHALRNLTYTQCALSVCCCLDFILHSCACVIKKPRSIPSFTSVLRPTCSALRLVTIQATVRQVLHWTKLRMSTVTSQSHKQGRDRFEWRWFLSTEPNDSHERKWFVVFTSTDCLFIPKRLSSFYWTVIN